jgi:putative ABC transport system permease protein
MNGLLLDLRRACRLLLKSPGYAFVVILTLGLGIGANTTIYSAVYAYLLRPLPCEDPERLMFLGEEFLTAKSRMLASYPNFVDWREMNTTFTDMTAYRYSRFNITGTGEPERVRASQVTESFFSVLGVQPLAGRGFLPDEDKPGGERVVVLSFGLWQRRYGGRQDIVGDTILLNGAPYTVVGIMPATFQFPDRRSTLWVPLAADYNTWGRDHHDLYGIGRLAPGVSSDSAHAELKTIAAQLEQQYPTGNKGWSVRLEPLQEHMARFARTPVLVLMATVGFVLLIACANVANLLLARVTSRRKEIAIRTALGASRFRAVRQVLAESITLSLAGGVAGLGLSFAGVRAVVASMASYMLPVGGIQVDGTVVVFTILVSLFTGIVFGLAPALHATRTQVNETLKEGGRTSATGHGRIRRTLVVTEIALAVMLLVGAGLLMRSFVGLVDIDAGFETDNIITSRISLPNANYAEPGQRSNFIEQLRQNVSHLPGVTSAALVSDLPTGDGAHYRSFEIEGRPHPEPDRWPEAAYSAATPGYFETLGIPLLRGRPLAETDTDGSPPVVVINNTMATRFWPDENPVGKRIRLQRRPDEWRTVVGVAGDVHHVGLEEHLLPEMFIPHRQDPSAGTVLVFRTTTDPQTAATALRAAVREMDPNQPIADVRTLQQTLADTLAPNRVTTFLLAIFAAIALLLAVMGLYSVICYSVAERTRELGIRMALGAAPIDVLAMVVRQGFSLAVAGVAIGLAGAFGTTRLLSALLTGVSATDPLIFAAVPMLLALVAISASFFPARRAARVNPTTALNH